MLMTELSMAASVVDREDEAFSRFSRKDNLWIWEEFKKISSSSHEILEEMQIGFEMKMDMNSKM